jgi:hypothetical protein
MRVQACACGFLLATAFAVSAGERLTIAVSTSQGFAPATATIRVHVTPHANNRGLEVSVTAVNQPTRRGSQQWRPCPTRTEERS